MPAVAETPALPKTETLHDADLTVATPTPSAHVLAKDSANKAPDPGAPQPAPAAAPVPGPMLPPKLDRNGTPFDPSKHSGGMHPKTGAWMPKRAKREPMKSDVGRLPSNAPKSQVAQDHTPEEAPQASVPVLDEFKAAAVAACSILYASGMTLGGDEWRPSHDEHTNLCLAFENYFRAKGTTDISPGWALAIAVVAYAGPRFRQPKTVGALQTIGGAFKRFAGWWRARRTVKQLPKED